MVFSFIASLRVRNNGKAPASWYFVTVPQNFSDEIKQVTSSQPRKGWGSVRVEARIGFYSWKTSIFPDKKSGCYLLPVKAQVRKALQIDEGDEVAVDLMILS